MTTALQPVSPTCNTVFQPGQGQPASTIVNQSPITIYVDSNPQLTTTQGFPLNPAAVLPWPAKTPLYLIAPAAGGLANVLIGQTVNYWDPTTLATAINLIGVPSIDQFTNIVSGFSTADGSAHDIAIGDISKYQSLRVQIRAEETATGATPPGAGFAEIRQWSTGFSDLISVDRCTFLGNNNRGQYFTQYLQIPCKGAALSLNISWPTVGVHVVYQVYGSFRTYVDRLCGWMPNGYWGQSGVGSYAGGVGEDGFVQWIIPAGGLGAGVTVTDYPPLHPGPFTLTWDVTGNAANTIDLFLQDFITGNNNYGVRNADATSPAGAGVVVQNGYLAARCPSLAIRNRAGAANAANIRVSLTNNLQ